MGNSRKRTASKDNEPAIANKVRKVSADKRVSMSAKAPEVSANKEVRNNQIQKAVRCKSFGVGLEIADSMDASQTCAEK